MIKKLLITGSFFVFESNLQRLREAGYEVIRLEQPAATEDELIEALKGVSVYIIGGTEQVTEAVVSSTDSLETIIFNGVDYDKFIPAADAAQAKGIKILNAPGANTVAVAEFAVGVAIAMQRDLFGISRTGEKKFQTTRSLQGSVVGLIGAGNVAQAIIAGVAPFGPAEILYSNRTQREMPARMVSLEELVAASDILFVTLPLKAGMVLNKNMIDKIKTDCLIVNLSPMGLVDFDALFPRLQRGELRCAVDWPAPSAEFEKLPLDVWLHVQSHSAYNTAEAIRRVSDSVTDTAIGLL